MKLKLLIKKELKKEITKKQLDLIPKSFDIVGDILIFSDFPKELNKKQKRIGETILKNYKHVKVVCKKTKKYSGKYRTPKLKIIAGEKRKITEHKENNIKLKLNIEKCYFSSRSSTERKRISQQVKKNEEILVLFSGIAPLPCVISKNSNPKKITGIEINPKAHKFAIENIKLNKLQNINLIKGDVKKILPKINKKFDRILMPLPKNAELFLKYTFKIAKNGAMIHLYTFGKEEEYGDIKLMIKEKCSAQNKKCKVLNITKCGHFSPGTFRLCINFRVY